MEFSANHIHDTSYQFLPFSETIQEQIEKDSKDKELQKKVDILTSKILQNNPTIQTKYKFIVFRSDSTQILHTQWWKIFIPDSLIQLTKNDAELNFILAHEIWHWENKDIQNNSVKKYLSPWEIHEAECLADWYAWKVTKILGYDQKNIEEFLAWLEKRSLRPKQECGE